MEGIQFQAGHLIEVEETLEKVPSFYFVFTSTDYMSFDGTNCKLLLVPHKDKDTKHATIGKSFLNRHLLEINLQSRVFTKTLALGFEDEYQALRNEDYMKKDNTWKFIVGSLAVVIPLGVAIAFMIQKCLKQQKRSKAP